MLQLLPLFSTGAKETVYNTEKTHVSGGKGEPSMHLKRVALTKGGPSQWYCLIEFFCDSPFFERSSAAVLPDARCICKSHFNTATSKC